MRTLAVLVVLCPALCALRSQSGSESAPKIKKSLNEKESALHRPLNSVAAHKLQAALVADGMSAFIDAVAKSHTAPGGAIFAARLTLRNATTAGAQERGQLYAISDVALGVLCEKRGNVLRSMANVVNEHAKCADMREHTGSVSAEMKSTLEALEKQVEDALAEADERRDLFNKGLQAARHGAREVLKTEAALVQAYIEKCVALGRQLAPEPDAKAAALAIVLVEKRLMDRQFEKLRNMIPRQPEGEIAAVLNGDEDILEDLWALSDADLGDPASAHEVLRLGAAIKHRLMRNKWMESLFNEKMLHKCVAEFNGRRIDVHRGVFLAAVKALSPGEISTGILAIELANRICKRLYPELM